MNSYTWGGQRAKPKSTWVHSVDAITAMEARLATMIDQKIENMTLAPSNFTLFISSSTPPATTATYHSCPFLLPPSTTHAVHLPPSNTTNTVISPSSFFSPPLLPLFFFLLPSWCSLLCPSATTQPHYPLMYSYSSGSSTVDIPVAAAQPRHSTVFVVTAHTRPSIFMAMHIVVTEPKFGVHAQAVGKKVVKSNSLDGTLKVTSLLIGTNIAPPSPNQTNDLRMTNIYIMDKMRSCCPFSLSFLFILFLRDVACSPMPDKAQEVDEQMAEVAEDVEEDDFLVIEIHHHLQIHQENTHNRL
ncbi:hypothetical protein M9H77_18732 [Catharanthus roseus]|uniref:Uncharacterized protein n=1 Tax=Catharanthus roseus TaxID=4058 RepID=A0ACC0B8H9_CATRO|nr:hypothetical protein M9H77_18732 [Catharanthus roseus]